tara:strand:- start:41 stop:1243 length:1203 start_codon:yes stop_codon:yes gene_type:complete
MSQVSDYIIANASGASVRSDINLVLDAIKTLNSGGSDPSNTEAFMPYVDTADNNNLKIRNSQNNGFTTIGPVNEANLGLLPKSGGVMTGQLAGDDGSDANAPAYAFDNDADTGMFRNSANTLGFSTAAVERAIIDANGLTLRERGDLRLGDSNSSHYIGIQAPETVTSNQQVTFTAPVDGTNGQVLQTNGSGVLSFATFGSVPAGSVFCFAAQSPPTGYLECNGQVLARSGTYADLFAAIGTAFNTGGESSEQFRLPDLRGEFVRGYDHGRGVDSGRNVAHNVQGAQFGQHNHSFSATASGSGTTSTKSLTGTAFQISETFSAAPSPTGIFSKGANQNGQLTPGSPDTSSTGTLQIDASHNHTITISNINVSGNTGNQGGTGNSSETRPRNIALMYIIKF